MNNGTNYLSVATLSALMEKKYLIKKFYLLGL